VSDTALWQLEAEGAEAEIYAAAETLGFLEHMEALSLSVFETGPGQARLQAGYGSEQEAKAAGEQINLGFTVSQLPPTDWVSEVQKNLSPVPAGRFTLFGSHDRDTVEGEVCIEVEAGPAFGSGHHPTTRGCLEVFDALLAKGVTPTRVLDVGCGTGVLAIAAALTTEAEIVASDIDPDAVEVTLATAKLNGAQLTAFQADGMNDPRLSGPFDLIFANILAGPLRGLAPDIAKAAQKDGLVILSGLLNAQAEDMIAAYAAAGLQSVRAHSIEEWTTLLLQKP
jgi:ribosomal protein L11 methyltransferase